MQDQFGSLVMPFIGMLFVILLAYCGTKFISTKYVRMGCGNYIKVLERTTLGQDRSLVLVKINNKVMLLGVTAKNISTVSEFDQQEFSLETELPESKFSLIFAESLKKSASFIHIPQLKIRKRDDRED